ncbi:MAG: preprotein translocase subunit SecY [Candidatus Flemingibacterium sp.]|nr:preprotein translocase subunit SecY [Candidatus Flemingibacterium sp.]
MFKTLRNAFSLPELRKKILYVIFIIVLYRIGAAIPIPYINASMMDTIKGLGNGSILQYMSILSGTAFSRATLFALSISPYINASIIIQLLCTAIPALENMAKEEDGRNKITQITRYVTVGLALITAYGYYMMLRNYGLIINKSVFSAIVIIACYTAGSCLIMWLGEKINENGIGNGISIILFVNIVSSIPSVFSMLISYFKNGIGGIITAIVTIIIAVFMVVFIIFMTNSERRLPIQYAKRVVGRKMYGGQSSTLPLKLNMAGVMPIIFANSILALPSTIAMFFPTPKEGTFWYGFQRLFSYTSWLYAVVFMVLIVFFSYFYIAISFNPIEVSNNLKKNGGFIPGIRPGKPTADYITKVLNKVTLMGAFFLGIIAVLPLAANIISGNRISGIAFAGTSIIIVVGVALETAREIEAQMTMRHYKGFLE